MDIPKRRLRQLRVYSEMLCDARYRESCTSSGKAGWPSYRNWYSNRRTHIYSQTRLHVRLGNPTPPHTEENVEAARGFRPMTREEEEELVASANPYARELMYYKP